MYKSYFKKLIHKIQDFEEEPLTFQIILHPKKAKDNDKIL